MDELLTPQEYSLAIIDYMRQKGEVTDTDKLSSKEKFEIAIKAQLAKVHRLEIKGGNMKTIEEIRDAIDASEQELDTFSRDAVMGKIEFTESEGKYIEGYIKALKWAINEK